MDVARECIVCEGYYELNAVWRVLLDGGAAGGLVCRRDSAAHLKFWVDVLGLIWRAESYDFEPSQDIWLEFAPAGEQET